MEKEMQIEKQGSMKINVQHGRRFLPDEIVREILSRLPVKSLLRYMSVSKNWKSLISHYSFIKLHHQKSLDNNPPSMLVLHNSHGTNNVLTTFDLAGEVVQQWSLPHSNLEMLPFPSQSKLVCFTDRKRFFLCNPSTRQLTSLPDLSFNPCFAGFGYVPSSDEYLIVNLFRTNRSTNFDCEILTLSISNDDEQMHYNAWRSIEAMDLPQHSDRWGVFVGGAFYWTISDRDGNVALLSFDTDNEVFSTIRMPLEFQKPYRAHTWPLEIKGEIHVMSASPWPNTLQLWKLSDVKNQLWTQIFTQRCNSLNFNKDVLMNRLKHLHYHNEPYNISSTYLKKLTIGNKVIRPWGVGIHTNLFSL